MAKNQSSNQAVVEVPTTNRVYFLNRLNTLGTWNEEVSKFVQKATEEVVEGTLYFPMLKAISSGMETSLNGIANLTKFDKAIADIETVNAQAAMLLNEGVARIELRQPDLNGIKVVARWRDNSETHEEVKEVGEVAQIVELKFVYGDEETSEVALTHEELVNFLTAKGVTSVVAESIATSAMRKIGGGEDQKLYLVHCNKEVRNEAVANIAIVVESNLKEIARRLSGFVKMNEYLKEIGESSEDEEESSEDANGTAEESADVVASIQ